MKIIYLTDIHDGLHGLKRILNETEADLYLFSGDIIYKAFFSEERIINFCGLQEEFYSILQSSHDDIKPFDLATKMIRFPNKYSKELFEKGLLYRDLFQSAAKTMKEKYALIEALIQKYSKSPVLALPGNYDIDLQYTALYERDLHRKSFYVKELKISGYGGAPIPTSGIPEKLAVVFHEYFKNGKNYSEPEDFFEEEKPDICVIHNPAYGYLDKIPGLGHVGSQGIRRYLDENNPSLVVSGHVHEDQGILRKNNTIFLNPSNFGAVDSISGYQKGGYYSEIFLEDKKILEIHLNRMREGENICLMKIINEKNGLTAKDLHTESDVSIDNFFEELMVAFLTLVGVLGTVAFFIYMLSAYDNKQIDRSQIARNKEEDKFKSADPRKIYNKNWDPNVPRPRVCPACGTLLKKDEYLYASISEYINSEGKRQAHIYGCKYCYLGEVNSSGINSEPKEIDGL